MSVKIGYQDDRLIISGLRCGCPCSHSEPTQDIYVGTGLLDKIPAYIKRRELGRKCVVVCDSVTYEVAGRRVYEALLAKRFKATLCLLEREGELVPDERAVGELLMSMTMETEFFVSVGSGSITDITRTVAAQTERPFVCVATAPSMDGYTSMIAPMMLRGVKMHVKAICPELIVCDLDVLRTAPQAMFISGVGDVLGKYIAKADWMIGHIVNDEDYCPSCAKIAIDAANKLLENIGEIKSRSEVGARILIEALLLSGLTIMIIGNTRAVASVEHNIAHYWEMMRLRDGHPLSHGTSVGVATLLVWPYFENFAKLDLASFDWERARAAAPSRELREAFMIEHYGERAAGSIMDENPGDFLTEQEHRRRFDAIATGFEKIAAELKLLPSEAEIRGAMVELGAPLTPAEIDIDDRLVQMSLACAKDYRTRYTLFKSIAELGLEQSTPNFDERA